MAFISFKGGRRTKPEAAPQKPWMSSPSLAGGDASAPGSGLTLALQWPCPAPASLGLEGAGALGAAAPAESLLPQQEFGLAPEESIPVG